MYKKILSVFSMIVYAVILFGLGTVFHQYKDDEHLKSITKELGENLSKPDLMIKTYHQKIEIDRLNRNLSHAEKKVDHLNSETFLHEACNRRSASYNTSNKEEIKTEVEWTLVEDSMPGKDCSTVVYKGEVAVRGYVELVIGRGDIPRPLFRIIDEDLHRLPYPSASPHFVIANHDVELLARYGGVGDETTISITEFRGYCEGPLSIKIRLQE